MSLLKMPVLSAVTVRLSIANIVVNPVTVVPNDWNTKKLYIIICYDKIKYNETRRKKQYNI